MRGLAPDVSQFVAQHIQDTVQRWDAQELADLVELNIGKDLHYIRINGTLVGGLDWAGAVYRLARRRGAARPVFLSGALWLYGAMARWRRAACAPAASAQRYRRSRTTRPCADRPAPSASKEGGRQAALLKMPRQRAVLVQQHVVQRQPLERQKRCTCSRDSFWLAKTKCTPGYCCCARCSAGIRAGTVGTTWPIN